jgi:hypothetical protein
MQGKGDKNSDPLRKGEKTALKKRIKSEAFTIAENLHGERKLALEDLNLIFLFLQNLHELLDLLLSTLSDKIADRPHCMWSQIQILNGNRTHLSSLPLSPLPVDIPLTSLFKR